MNEKIQLKMSRLGSLVLLLTLAAGLIGCSGSSSEIQVGVGEVVVTPNDGVGLPMSGFDRGNNTSTGVHDDLFARSLVIEGADGNSIALITVAIINISEEIHNRIREIVTSATGIPNENIVITSTHTHSGPNLGGLDESVTDRFIEQTASSAVQAWENRVPGRIGVGSTVVRGLGFKRDALGQGGVHPDPEVGVIKAEDAGGRLMGVFFNHGAHPSTLDLHNLMISEDWPYFAISGVKQEVGEDVVVAFVQGAEGDINSGYNALMSAVGANMNGGRSFEQIEWKGELMSDALLEVLPGIETRSDISVNAAHTRLDLPRRTAYPWTVEEAQAWEREAQERLEEMEARLPTEYPTNREETDQWQQQARQMAQNGELDVRNQIGPRYLDTYRVDVWVSSQVARMAERIASQPENPEPINVPMQSLKIGDAVFVTFPNEVYAEIGLAVKQQSPVEKTFIIGLAGGRRGYIPTAADHLERGYVPNGTPYAPETGQILIDTSLNLIQRVAD